MSYCLDRKVTLKQQLRLEKASHLNHPNIWQTGTLMGQLARQGVARAGPVNLEWDELTYLLAEGNLTFADIGE